MCRDVFVITHHIEGGIVAHYVLVADSLDMLADAFVYGMSLFAIGGTSGRKKAIANWSGYLQLGLASLGLLEVVRRFIASEALPDFQTMIVISLLALAGNAVCLWLLQRTHSDEAHMQASKIFTSNDVVINSGVIIAGVLVYLSSSRLPDLVIGSIVFVIVLRGALRILQLARE
jgi:Co/Zn/Cd efflux system component